MQTHVATAIAHPNIAFIKYWGNRDADLRIPANGSISMNLDRLYTQTRVNFDPNLTSDQVVINDRPAADVAQQRVRSLLDRVRQMSGKHIFARVISQSNFPTGAGIASSASAFAALSLAAATAARLDLSQRDLSRLARTGSGSACRSVPGGFVEWRAGESDEDSYAYSIAPSEYWDLIDCIAIVNPAHKPIGSTEGHTLADSSPLQPARVNDAPRRLDWCRRAILERDFESLAHVVELDSNLMHAVMMTSTPPLIYWEPATLAVIHTVQAWRRGGLPVCYTIDAGPNVHVLCLGEMAHQVVAQLNQIHGVENVLSAPPGPPAHLIESNS
jgi:diphosphomevalonate decarboxylase